MRHKLIGANLQVTASGAQLDGKIILEHERSNAEELSKQATENSINEDWY